MISLNGLTKYTNTGRQTGHRRPHPSALGGAFGVDENRKKTAVKRYFNKKQGPTRL